MDSDRLMQSNMIFYLLSWVLFWVPTCTLASPIKNPLALDFATAVKQAQIENKAILFILSDKDCLPCHQMQQNVLANHRILAELSKFLTVMLNSDDAKVESWQKEFPLNSFPSFLLISNGGFELERMIGTASKSTFLAFLRTDGAHRVKKTNLLTADELELDSSDRSVHLLSKPITEIISDSHSSQQRLKLIRKIPHTLHELRLVHSIRFLSEEGSIASATFDELFDILNQEIMAIRDMSEVREDLVYSLPKAITHSPPEKKALLQKWSLAILTDLSMQNHENGLSDVEKIEAKWVACQLNHSTYRKEICKKSIFRSLGALDSKALTANDLMTTVDIFEKNGQLAKALLLVNQVKDNVKKHPPEHGSFRKTDQEYLRIIRIKAELEASLGEFARAMTSWKLCLQEASSPLEKLRIHMDIFAALKNSKKPRLIFELGKSMLREAKYWGCSNSFLRSNLNQLSEQFNNFLNAQSQAMLVEWFTTKRTQMALMNDPYALADMERFGEIGVGMTVRQYQGCTLTDTHITARTDGKFQLFTSLQAVGHLKSKVVIAGKPMPLARGQSKRYSLSISAPKTPGLNFHSIPVVSCDENTCLKSMVKIPLWMKKNGKNTELSLL